MKNYIIAAFHKTVEQDYPAQADALCLALEQRLNQLRAENAGASKEKQQHLESQILPGIAAYETLQTVMSKEQALQTVHGYVEEHAWKLRKLFWGLIHIPGFYRQVPKIFANELPKMFGPAAGFTFTGLELVNGVFRADMLQCPYHDTCVQYGCPELCPSFCDSDDITYDNLHPKLIWHRSKTLGRGGDCCDFGLEAKQ